MVVLPEQYQPAWHGSGTVVATSGHANPAGHGAHSDTLRSPPLSSYVPIGHGFSTPVVEPDAQEYPGGHRTFACNASFRFVVFTGQ